MKKTAEKPQKPRLLSRVLAEDLAQAQGASACPFCTFTRCPIDVCDYDLD